jgi:hypothetical protein
MSQYPHRPVPLSTLLQEPQNLTQYCTTYKKIISTVTKDVTQKIKEIIQLSIKQIGSGSSFKKLGTTQYIMQHYIPENINPHPK